MTYTIKRGNHYSDAPMGLTCSTRSVSALVRFTESCRYDIGHNQLDWNKLIGRSTHGLLHHRNSMRIGWRVVDELDKIELCAYTYKDGERSSDSICYVEIGEVFEAHISHIGLTYAFRITRENGETHRKYVGAKPPYQMPLPCVKLRPYFGGTSVAPHDIKIDIDI